MKQMTFAYLLMGCASTLASDSMIRWNVEQSDKPVAGGALPKTNNLAPKSGTPRFTTIGEFGTKGWKFLDETMPGESRIGGFPRHYWTPVGYAFTIPYHYVVEGSKAHLELVCGSTAPGVKKYCDATIFLYECADCGFKQHAHFASVSADLTSRGFQRSRCAPTFTTGKPGGKTHSMIAFTKLIENDEVEDVIFDGQPIFAAFAISHPGVKECSDLNPVNCFSDSHGRCEVKGGNCVLSRCIPSGPPTGGCSHCAVDEIYL